MSTFPPFAAEPYGLPDDLAGRLLTPALCIYRPIVEANVGRILVILGGDPGRWRPHLKTTKSPDLWRLLLERGIRQFKCATTREARLLLETADAAGHPDVDLLIAYPHVEPALSQLAALARRFPRARVSVLCETPEAAHAIPNELGIFPDLDSGMHRTGLTPARWDDWQPIARELGVRFRGVHFYDGHLRDPDVEVRTPEAARGYDSLLAFVNRLEESRAPVREIITSGTPALMPAIRHEGLIRFHAPRDGRVHRVSAGTVLLHDAGYAVIAPELALTPAAVVMSRVISAPVEGRITLDAGSKSLAAETGDPCACIAGHTEWRALTPSEEHLPIEIGGAAPPAPGTMLRLIPRHVCPTVNLAERAILIERDGSWREIEIIARAHDLLARESRRIGGG